MSKEEEPPEKPKRLNIADLSVEDKISLWEALKKKNYSVANEVMKKNLQKFVDSCSSMDKMGIS